MSVAGVSAALEGALERGDVVELENAIKAAEDALHVSSRARKPSSSLGSLIARAKDMYMLHMEACRSYIKPLRKACKELSDRGIFEALVRARGAPDEIQLCMYTDLCNAETLRRDIVEAQKIAVQLLDATSAADVDDFLNECSPFLEDRTILALVQKREDLLREEKRRIAGRLTPLRNPPHGASKGSVPRHYRDPLEELGRHHLDDQGASPVRLEPRNASPSRATSSNGRPPAMVAGSSGERGSSSVENISPRGSTTAPTAYPAIRGALEKMSDRASIRSVEGGASPWMQAMRSLRQQAYEEVVRDERQGRQHLEEQEMGRRAEIYRAEMVDQVQCWAQSAFKSPTGSDDDRDEEEGATPTGDEPALVSKAVATGASPPPAAAQTSAGGRWTQVQDRPRQTPPPSSSPPAASRGAGATPTRVYAHALPTYPIEASSGLTARAPRDEASAAGAHHAADAILGGAVRSQLSAWSHHSPSRVHSGAATQHTPRALRDTPNISPIKEMSATSGAGSMWGEQDVLDHRGDAARPGWAEGTVPSPTPRRRDSLGSAAGTATSTGASSSMASSMAASPTLELRRIQARLRAVLQEEDIHRRDIEGTEDFDRSVFLFPVSARIAMLRRTASPRLRSY